MLELHRLLQEHRERGQNGDHTLRIPVFDEAAFRLGKYADGTLLRFRGIIRDVLDPELVLLGDVGEHATDGDYVATVTEEMHDKFVERVPLKVALVPYVSDWAAKRYHSTTAATRDDDSVTDAEVSKSKGTKRANEELDEAEDSDAAAALVSAETAKKAKAVSVDAPTDSATTPAFDEPLVSMYAYDGQYTGFGLDVFKVNESFEFIGVLDMMVVGAAAASPTIQHDDAFSSESIATLTISDCLEGLQRKQQSSVVLHCCDATSLETLQFVQPHKTSASLATNDMRRAFLVAEWQNRANSSNIVALRQSLIDQLSCAIGGDVLAAEYLLLCMLSRVYSRPDSATALGNLSVNLAYNKSVSTSTIGASIDRIEAALEAIVPMLASIDMSIQSLNGAKFLPHKDYDRDVLRGGILQFAHGTTVLVNETKLSAGNLNDQGVKNIGALQSLVEKMLLPYDFQYYSMDFPQNVAVVSVSQGKSILPVHVSVPVHIDQAATATTSTVSDAALECFRLYLAVLRSFEVRLGNEQAEMAEKHYVACRKAKQEVTIEDLHRWLRLARLVAISRGEDEVSPVAWESMLSLETQRTTRLDEAEH